jgi:gluconate kinase
MEDQREMLKIQLVHKPKTYWSGTHIWVVIYIYIYIERERERERERIGHYFLTALVNSLLLQLFQVIILDQTLQHFAY